MRGGLINCPNCGAPVTGGRCEYCGTLFLDFGALNVDKPTYIRIRTESGYMLFHAQIQDMEMEQRVEPQTYFWNDPRVIVHEPIRYTLRFTAVGVPNGNGVVFIESTSPAIGACDQDAAGLEGAE